MAAVTLQTMLNQQQVQNDFVVKEQLVCISIYICATFVCMCVSQNAKCKMTHALPAIISKWVLPLVSRSWPPSIDKVTRLGMATKARTEHTEFSMDAVLENNNNKNILIFEYSE